MVLLTRRQKVHLLIHNAAIAAGGIGAGWLSELWLVPDAIPLSILQAGMLWGLGFLFLLRPGKALLLALVASFAVTLLGRGLSGWLFVKLPEEEILVNVVVAMLLTEGAGWLLYNIFRALRKRPAESLLASALSASQRGPLRVVLLSAPMLLAACAALVVLNVRHRVEVRLVAPGGSAPLLIEHPLIERHEGGLLLSGQARGQQVRSLLPVRNDVLADGLERHVFLAGVSRVRVLALVPQGTQGEALHIVDRTWTVEVRQASDYWLQVRSRLYLLLLGLLGTLTLMWLGQHRSRAIDQVS